MSRATTTIETIHWYGCYREGWNGTLTPHAYQHPAKVSFGLSKRLYRHMLERGYIRPGDTVLDPFAGVGGFAFHALKHGLRFVGVELEDRFVTLAQGTDCPGLDAAFWRRYQGRGRKWHDLGICPDCGDVLDADNKALPLLHWFGTWRRAVPHRQPHRYQGNIERWQALGLPGTARVVQGDSRRLLAVLGEADCAVSSPPYADSFNGRQYDNKSREQREREAGVKLGGGQINHPRVYGDTPGQLGAMPEGDVDAVIGSPPYADAVNSGKGGIDWEKAGRPDRLRESDKRKNPMSTGEMKYGNTDGQLGSLPEGDLDAALSSPPYSDTVDGSGEGPGARHDYKHHAPDNATKRSSANGYGRTPGNLGNMPGYDAAVSSSPWAGTVASEQSEDFYYARGKTGKVTGTVGQEYGGSRYKLYNEHPYMSPEWIEERRRQSEHANLGRLPEEAKTVQTFWQAARVILEQTFAALKPGGVAAWVTGNFRRNGQIVDFGGQWLALCEAVGFVPLERVVAWKREPGPLQLALVGEPLDHTVDRVSFFRRLDNEKNEGAEILNEDVWIVQKPRSTA